MSIYLREIDGIQKQSTGRELRDTPERMRRGTTTWPATPGSRFLPPFCPFCAVRKRIYARQYGPSHLRAAGHPNPGPCGFPEPPTEAREWPTPTRTNIPCFDEVQNFLGTSPLTYQLRVGLI